MDIGGRTDCGCRLDDKFFFRSTPAPVLFRPFIPIGIGVKKTRASLIILDLSAADCNAFFFFPVLRRLKNGWSWIFYRSRQIKIDCRDP